MVEEGLIGGGLYLARTVGHYLALSPARRLIGDLLYFAHKIPTVPVQKLMHLGDLAQMREKVPGAALDGILRPRWPALFIKAYALTAMEMPALRRAYLRWPWERLYQHSHSVVSVAVSKEIDGEEMVLFGHIHQPEDLTVGELETRLRLFKNEPPSRFGVMRRAMRISRLPRFLRRLLWWSALDWSGPMRANHLGTFGLSVYSGLGAESLHPLSPLTNCLTFGPVSASGEVMARLIYDHRVMDGSLIARALGRMEEHLQGALLQEVRTIAESCSGRKAG